MKPNADEVVKTFKGLAIAAARAAVLAARGAVLANRGVARAVAAA